MEMYCLSGRPKASNAYDDRIRTGVLGFLKEVSKSLLHAKAVKGQNEVDVAVLFFERNNERATDDGRAFVAISSSER